MGLLLAQADKLQLPALQAGVMQEIINKDEVFGVLPFLNISPYNRHEFNRELTLGTAVTASWIIPTGTITESAPTFTQISNHTKVILDAARVGKLYINDPNVVGSAIAAKAKTVSQAWSKAFIVGTGGSDDIVGLSALVSGSATQDIAMASAGSGSLTLAKMDEVFDAVKSGRPSFYVMNGRDIRSFKSLIRSSGTTAEYLQLENYGSPVLSYNGIPILKNDWVTADGSSKTHVYCAYASEVDGLTGFYNGSGLIDVTGPIEVTESDMVEYKIAFRVGLSLMSTLSLARLNGVLSV